MKLILLCVFALSLSSCFLFNDEEYPKNVSDFLPKELQDCQMYKISKGLTTLFVTRCPNSSTSTSTSEKSPKHSTVIEENLLMTKDKVKKRVLLKLTPEEKQALDIQ